ncbi:hypothetical protein E8D34_13790 [Nocardioides sp. GY 10113]|uniref:hypothetical protein n=1 Tax=Nocardioides sp. GY 10113 TaxID=2569761 RepID=UPI0010A8D08A|nr:hypothetical protein [Nocardioides sp. GY 10113]TIC85135.1 hypothetical protein E8D34_13790 [Nocardioides sp. GY 10113]
MRPTLLAAALLLPALAACGTATVPEDQPADQPAGPYDGPLVVAHSDAVHPDAGAAGNVVDCRTWGSGGRAFGPGDLDADEVYGEGATADSPEGALETAAGEGLFGPVPGLTLVREEPDRALFVVQVDGVAKQAVIVRNGPATEGAGGPGWYLESWARCDASEQPPSYAEARGLEIWTDASGRPAPTTEIVSRPGPEHCDWQSVTFLTVGDLTFASRPIRGLAERFADDVPAGPVDAGLPADARDSGYHRADAELWLGADGRTAFLVEGEDTTAWPRVLRPVLCM